MFWLRKKKIIFSLCTLNLSPDLQYSSRMQSGKYINIGFLESQLSDLDNQDLCVFQKKINVDSTVQW